MRTGWILIVVAIGVVMSLPWRVGLLVADALVTAPGYLVVDDGTDRYWDAKNLEWRLGKVGFKVVYGTELEYEGREAYGLTDFQTREIAVDSTLSWNERFNVLAHEGGHALQPRGLTRNQGEVFAQTVGYLIAGHLRESARYLSSMRADLLTALVYDREAYRVAYILETL